MQPTPDPLPSSDGPDEQADLTQAASLVRQAVQEGHVEGICEAYFLLRRAGGVGDALSRPYLCNGLLDEHTKRTVCHAYARRHCFMCNAAALACETCGQTGLVEGDICRNCHGLGHVPCSFCRGTGWADPATVPAEWRRGVARAQLQRTRAELQKLCHGLEHHNLRQIEHLPVEGRRVLHSRLHRVSARIQDLLARGAVANSKERKTFPQMVAMLRKIEQDLEESMASLDR